MTVIAEEGTRRVVAEDWRPEEHRLEGWEEFRVTDQQNEVIRGRFHAVNKELGRRGVRVHVRQERRRPGMVVGVDPPRWVGTRPT
jgi:hypothetical protein